MASPEPWVLEYIQCGVLSYLFKDLALLVKALVSGDSNSADREGNRGLAQLGDAVMSMVIISEGLKKGVSRRMTICKMKETG